MPHNSRLKEFLLYAAFLILGTMALIELDAFDALYEFSRSHEEWELDEFILVIPAVLICLALFSFNRSRELRDKARELDQARRELAEAHERLLEMAQDRENFIAVSCHELKSPLNGIVHALELTEMTKDADELKEGFDLAKSAAKGLGAVIDGVLEFSRLDSMKNRRRVEFSLRDMVEAIRTLASLQADAKGLALDVRLDAAVPKRVLGHEAGLRLAVLNLVGNAVKYTESGTVSVGLAMDRKDDAQELVVTVADTGIGIPENELGSIFDPYQRTSLARGEGLGLGLTIVRRLVDGMGGTVSVSSTVGQGTEFVLRVPVSPA